jgi:hypothetical protein
MIVKLLLLVRYFKNLHSKKDSLLRKTILLFVQTVHQWVSKALMAPLVFCGYFVPRYCYCCCPSQVHFSFIFACAEVLVFFFVLTS